MPELPEIETIKRGLEVNIQEHFVESIWQNECANFRLPIPHNLLDIIGKKIISVKRRAKYLLIDLDDEILVFHLGMSGKILLQQQYQQKKHDHLVIFISGGYYLIFNDPRRFGLYILISSKSIDNHMLFSRLGKEPLEQDFTPDYLYLQLQKRKIPIKQAIMDNRIVVGVGNIYASESLHRAKISPIRISSNIGMEECVILVKNIRIILDEAIKSGGSTLRDYVKSSGDKGYFQHHFAVYGKDGEICGSCKNGAIIQKITQAGRSSYFCANCQID